MTWVHLAAHDPDLMWENEWDLYYHYKSKMFAYEWPRGSGTYVMWDGTKWIPYNDDIFKCKYSLLGVCYAAPR